jgi:transposase
MDVDLSDLPDDLAALKAVVIAAVAKTNAVAAELANEQARRAEDAALIAHMKLQIEKLRRDKFGPSSERSSRLLDQMAFELEELESTATEDELAAEMAAAKASNVAPFTRNRPSRKPFPEHLPRERVIVPGPTTCTCCGSSRLAKLGETITETLETIPRTWKVIAHVREKFTCRDCEKISQAPAPFHVIHRGWAGPSFLAMLVFEKFGQHQPLNRQAERYAREGVPLSLSTLADQVGACCVVLEPIFNLILSHVFAGERIHGDDTTVPVLAKGKTDIARSWVYVRDDRPFAGPAPPAVVFYYSRDRSGVHFAAAIYTWQHIPEFSRRMPLPGTINSTKPAVHHARSWRLHAGAMPGANFSNWLTLLKPPSARHGAKSLCLHRPRRLRRCGASTNCLISSVTSTANQPRREGLFGKNSASR